MIKKLTKYILGTLLGTLILGASTMAADTNYTVTPVASIGKTNTETVVLDAASDTANVILTKDACPDGVDIAITGITSNGYWEIDLGQPVKYYCIGSHLDIGGAATTTAAPVAMTEIEKKVKYVFENVPSTGTTVITYLFNESNYRGITVEELVANQEAYAKVLAPYAIQRINKYSDSSITDMGAIRFHMSGLPVDSEDEGFNYNGYVIRYYFSCYGFRVTALTPSAYESHLDAVRTGNMNTYYQTH